MNRSVIKLFAVILLGFSAAFTGCSPEIVFARNLEGDLEVTSYTLDGEELMGFLITTFDMEFEEYDGDEGDFDFTVVFETGGSDALSGEYSLNSDGDEIDLVYSDGTVEMWDADLEGDDLELTAVIDGVRYVIEAERD